MEIKKIEKFFLNTMLIITIVGVFLVLLSNILLFPEDVLSIVISSSILLANILAYFIRHRYPVIAVLIITVVSLAAMSYQRWMVPNTSTPLAVVLIVGFIISVMLKRWTMWVMHAIAFIIINTVFLFHVDSVLTAAITYSTLYFILIYATAVLKGSYDRIHQYLRETNIKLNEKAKEIETQHEELLMAHDNLNTLNTDLEKIVNERTARILMQNEILIKYSYTNAHHLRGPVARLLGLASVYKLEPQTDPDFFISKMIDQANEIDSVVKQINIDLEANHVELTFRDYKK